jgi:hypothetical protein
MVGKLSTYLVVGLFLLGFVMTATADDRSKEIAALLEQLNKRVDYVPTAFKDAEAAKKYLEDYDVAFTKDAFWYQMSHGYYDLTEAYLKLGMSPDGSAYHGNADPAIQYATEQCEEAGEAQIALLLLLYGADPNVVHEKSNTSPIYWAVKRCPVEVVKALLLSGARVDIVPTNGDTLLGAAVTGGRVEVVQMILDAGYKVGKEPSYIFDAVKGKPEMQKLLQKAGVKK